MLLSLKYEPMFFYYLKKKGKRVNNITYNKLIFRYPKKQQYVCFFILLYCNSLDVVCVQASNNIFLCRLNQWLFLSAFFIVIFCLFFQSRLSLSFSFHFLLYLADQQGCKRANRWIAWLLIMAAKFEVRFKHRPIFFAKVGIFEAM